MDSNISYNVIHLTLLVKEIKLIKSETFLFYYIDGRELSRLILNWGSSKNNMVVTYSHIYFIRPILINWSFENFFSDALTMKEP